MEQTIAIHTENIKRYFLSGDGSIVRALDGVSMEIPSGSLTILKGRSGSGKTTLLNLLSALDVPTEGKVKFFGKDGTFKRQGAGGLAALPDGICFSVCGIDSCDECL